MSTPGFAKESTLSSILSIITTVFDVALSTRNEEATQLLVKAKTDNIDTPLSTLIGVLLPNLFSATQDVTGNTDVYTSSIGLTNADTAIYTVTGGKTFYIKTMQISGIFTANTSILIRDGAGGTILACLRGIAANRENIVLTYPDALKVTTSLYYDYVSGTITGIDVVAHGYEK